MFRSIIGVALIPLWWAGFLFVILVEEKSLERTLGQPYLDYKGRVKGRIIPGLPI
jgi:protein-S-isoprenylcysteine O-methyltransferase Ste14